MVVEVVSCGFTVALCPCVCTGVFSSAGRYWIVFDKFLVPTTSLRGMCVRDAKFAPCVNLTITSSVSLSPTSGTKSGCLLSSLLAVVSMTRSLLH